MLVETISPEDIECAPFEIVDGAELLPVNKDVGDVQEVELFHANENFGKIRFSSFPERNLSDNREASDRNSPVENFTPSDNTCNMFNDMLYDRIDGHSSLQNVNPAKISQASSSPLEDGICSIMDLNDIDISGIECDRDSPLNLARPKLIEDAPQNTTQSTASSKSNKSVDDILNSITMYKTKPAVQKKCRKKLILPFVITCDKWLELQRAKEREQADLETKKQEKKESFVRKEKGQRRETTRQKITGKVFMVF